MVTSRLSNARTRAARSRGVIGLFILVPCALLAMFSPARVAEATWTDFAFDSAGYLLFIAGAAMRWWATLYIESRKGSALVVEGPYSACRNPLYFGTFCMVLSIAAYLKSLLFAVGAVFAAAFYLGITLPVEELYLRNQFGESYTRYSQHVPRFWPRFTAVTSGPNVHVSVKGLQAEAVRALRWLWIPVLCALATLLRVQPWWPTPFNLP